MSSYIDYAVMLCLRRCYILAEPRLAAGFGRVVAPLCACLGRTLEAPIPKMSGLVRKHDLFSKAFICPSCFRAPGPGHPALRGATPEATAKQAANSKDSGNL